ncbi:hypothetical protein NP233_g11942 [Leucocoprinus birnbaumii]|uniref:Uncharacterized protein n=1 Tax=Leucocoprinus birnbaumii TaxID=56174 RepID=A0AAD5VL91_9AGAR|nr:hypothetical protein NP233_g11942 [Leucocoprinus birnbaumii]
MADEMRFKPLVNATFLPRWTGRVVRLPCEIISREGDTVKVKACDGGEINVNLIKGTEIEGKFALFTGPAVGDSEVTMLEYERLPDESNLPSRNSAIEFFHDERFSSATGYAISSAGDLTSASV